MQPIANILHQDTIRRLSTDGAFERGRAYFNEGRVVELARKDGSVVAKVKGSEAYAVRIWMHEDSLAYACSCPMGQERWFCKHAVAVALAFVGSIAGVEADAGTEPPKDAAKETPRVEPAKPEKAESPRPAPVRAKPLGPSTPAAVAPPPLAAPPVASAAPPAARPASLVEELRSMSHEDLLVFVLEAALDDEAFRARLVARLAR